MSLSRVSSLESWEFRPSSFNVRASLPAAVSPHRTGPSDCRTAQSIADPALLSSSFPSIVSKSSAPHRLSFNPAYGPSWTQNPYGYARLSVQGDDEWDERSVDSRVVGKASDTITEGREGEGRDVTLSENVDWLPGKPETISATEVPAGKRFGRYCVFVPWTKRSNSRNSSDLLGLLLLLLLSRYNIWLRGIETYPYRGWCLS